MSKEIKIMKAMDQQDAHFHTAFVIIFVFGHGRKQQLDTQASPEEQKRYPYPYPHAVLIVALNQIWKCNLQTSSLEFNGPYKHVGYNHSFD